MADVHVFTDPSVTIGGTEFICHFSRISLIPTDKMADVETFCDPGGERPSTTSWMAEFEVKQSYGTDGSWNLLRAMAKTKVAFVILPTDTTVAAGNPSATFNGWVPSIPFADGAVGEPTVYTMPVKVVGQPAFATT